MVCSTRARRTSRPQITEDGIEARGSAGLLDGVDTIAGAIDALLGRLGPDGYLAVMAYVDSERDAALHGVRETLSRRTGRPTTFGWGPRFLHSTGQYHKGGPPQGVFLQVTCAEADDVADPRPAVHVRHPDQGPGGRRRRRARRARAARPAAAPAGPGDRRRDPGGAAAMTAARAPAGGVRRRQPAAQTRRTGGCRGSPGRAAWSSSASPATWRARS